MIKVKYFFLPLFFFCLFSSAFSFSFSEYAAQEAEAERKAEVLKDIPVTGSCVSSLKAKKIALLIAEQEHLGPFVIRQSRYSRFYQQINEKLQKLGLHTYSPEEISNQIAAAELQSILNNDMEAAEQASRRLGADFFIKGIISSRTGINASLGIQEVYVTFDFTLTDSSGNVISTNSISAESYSNADTIGSLHRVVEENSSRVVNKLYNDYCAAADTGTSKVQSSPVVLAQAGSRKKAVDKKLRGTTAANDNNRNTNVDKRRNEVKTIMVSAEGLVDPNALTYKKDKGLMIDALRADARRQAIEKVVGVYVDSSTLVDNFMLINDRVLTQSKGFIKKIIKETQPWLGKDGLMHMMIKAEVFLSGVQEALQSMSRNERLNLIKESGNPTISVAILVKDARRSSNIPAQRSEVAENVLKSEFKGFGYRVWSEEYSKSLKGKSAAQATRREADFSVVGEVKFERKEIFLKASGNTLVRHLLTSWTVKCLNNHTGEEIYFNNKIPRKKSWESEDAAVADIGEMIGKEFSADFFKEQLMQTSRVYQLELTGKNPISYETALLLKKEFIGLRPVLNVELRDFSEGNQSIYEIEFAGKTQNFNQILHNSILKPLNAKLGEDALRLISYHGNVVKIAFTTHHNRVELNEQLETRVPASLVDAAPERVKALIGDSAVLNIIEAVNPHMQREGHSQKTIGSGAMIQNF
jgi:serine/threonine-protein kinase